MKPQQNEVDSVAIFFTVRMLVSSDLSESIWVNISTATTIANQIWASWRTTPLPLKNGLSQLFQTFDVRSPTNNEASDWPGYSDK